MPDEALAGYRALGITVVRGKGRVIRGGYLSGRVRAETALKTIVGVGSAARSLERMVDNVKRIADELVRIVGGEVFGAPGGDFGRHRTGRKGFQTHRVPPTSMVLPADCSTRIEWRKAGAAYGRVTWMRRMRSRHRCNSQHTNDLNRAARATRMI